MKKLFFLIMFSFSYNLSAWSQINPDPFTYVKAPEIAPSSPDVAAIEKFGNIPVDYSTGVPSISIPIYNIKCGQISWPIAFSYHAGGIRVDEVSSTVGLGWALTGPGVISRAVMGRQDVLGSNEPYYYQVGAAQFDYLYQVFFGNADSQLDIFSYNFNGRSGKFVIDQDGNIMQIPFTNMKITTNLLNSFTIVDEQGVTYFFDQQEYTNHNASGLVDPFTGSWYLSKVLSPDQKQNIEFQYTPVGNSELDNYTFTQSIGPKLVSTACNTFGSHETYGPPDYQVTTTITSVLQLSKILFPNGHIDLTYTSGRQDIYTDNNDMLTKVSVFAEDRQSPQLIKSFGLTQDYFFYRPAGAPASAKQYRLRLAGLIESGGTSSLVKLYGFEYNTTAMAPRNSYAQDKWGFNNGQEPNTSLIQTINSVSFGGSSYNVGSAIRTVDTTKMKACMLTAINWPTGGRSEYTYNAHQYATGTTITNTATYTIQAKGDLPKTASTAIFTYNGDDNPRFKVNISRFNFPDATQRPSVELHDVTDNVTVAFYANLNSSQTLLIDQAVNLILNHQYQITAIVYSNRSDNSLLTASGTVTWETWTGTPQIEKGGGLRIAEIKNYSTTGALATDDVYTYSTGITLTPYRLINETSKDVTYMLGVPPCPGFNGCTLETSAARLYYSFSPYPASTLAGSPVMYRKVNKYSVDNSGNTIGSTEYIYDVIQDNQIPLGTPFFNTFLVSNDWKNGFLLSEAQYSRNGTVYKLISKKENQYEEVLQDLRYTLRLYGNYIFSGCSNHNTTTVNSDLTYGAVPIITGSKKAYHIKQTIMDDNDNALVTDTYNDYEGTTHDFLTQTQVNDSKGNISRTTFKYPIDFSMSGNVYEKMVNKNIVSNVIEQKEYLDVTSPYSSTLLKTVKNNYRDWKNDALVLNLETVDAATYSNPLTTRIRYANYTDHKNPLEVKKELDKSVSYLWDFNFQYPVAQVDNASQTDIAYTSFEGDATGNWAYGTNIILDPTAPTGNKCYKATTNITRTGLNASGSYIVSYWLKSGTITVSGSVSKTTGRTIAGNWTYYEEKVNNPVSGTITVSGSTAILDELRLYPSVNALMTTYTYNPLVGLTSECDPNNRLVYYEYDEFQRLLLIRDQDHNVLKKFSYNYQSQTERPNVYYNLAQSLSFQKGPGCTGCNVGTNVVYTVPANMYSSTISPTEADAKALEDVNKNGPAYAAANGSCVAPAVVPVAGSNYANYSMTILFHNVCNGVNTTYTLANNTPSIVIPSILQGTYDITFTPTHAGTEPYLFTVNDRTLDTFHEGTITGVVLNQTSNLIIIHP